MAFLVQVLSGVLRTSPCPPLLLLLAGRESTQVFSGSCSIYNQGCRGAKVDLALLWSHTSSQRFPQQNPGPEASLLFAHGDETRQRLCQNQLLPAVSCCQTLPAPCPPARRCLFTAVSRWDPCVLEDRPGELNCPWSGVFYQALLQPSIIWIPRRDVGGWFPHRVSSGSCKPFLSSILSHHACPCSSWGWAMPDHILIRGTTFTFSSATEMC